MSMIFRNLRSFLRGHPLFFLLTVLCITASAMLMLFGYGMYQNYMLEQQAFDANSTTVFFDHPAFTSEDSTLRQKSNVMKAELDRCLKGISDDTICGGYHADTYWKCNLVFTLVTAVVLFFFRWMPVKQFTELHYCSIAIAILTTVFCTPVENENKPLTAKQKKHFRVLGTVMVVLLALISCLLIHFYQSSYSVLIDMTLPAVSISAFATELRRGVTKDDKNDERHCSEAHCRSRKEVC